MRVAHKMQGRRYDGAATSKIYIHALTAKRGQILITYVEFHELYLFMKIRQPPNAESDLEILVKRPSKMQCTMCIKAKET